MAVKMEKRLIIHLHTIIKQSKILVKMCFSAISLQLHSFKIRTQSTNFTELFLNFASIEQNLLLLQSLFLRKKRKKTIERIFF